MKKVIVKKESDTVNLNDVLKSKIYAYCNENKDIRVLTKFRGIYFFATCETTGGTYEKSSVKSLVESFINNGYDVYEFDTQREFLEWALANTK